MLIRDARTGDLDAIADLQARAIMAVDIETYDRKTLEAWALMGRQVRHNLLGTGTFFVAERDCKLTGVAGWTVDSREPDGAWVRYVFSDPDYRGIGIGRSLMMTVERSAYAAGRAHLRLWASLNAAGFYQALGYRKGKPGRWPIGGGVEMEYLLMEKSFEKTADG